MIARKLVSPWVILLVVAACSSRPAKPLGYEDFQLWMAKQPRQIELTTSVEPGADVDIYWLESNAANDVGKGIAGGAGKGALGGAYVSLAGAPETMGLSLLLAPFLVGGGAVIGAVVGGTAGAAKTEPTVHHYSVEEVEAAERQFIEAATSEERLERIDTVMARSLSKGGGHAVTGANKATSDAGSARAEGKINLIFRGFDFVGSQPQDQDLAMKSKMAIHVSWREAGRSHSAWSYVETEGSAHPVARWVADEMLLRQELDEAYVKLAKTVAKDINKRSREARYAIAGYVPAPDIPEPRLTSSRVRAHPDTNEAAPVPKDPRQVPMAAMERADAQEQYYLATRLSQRGETIKARRLFCLSAHRGFFDAQLEMGKLAQEEGDFEDAYFWYALATGKKRLDPSFLKQRIILETRDALGRKLDPEQRSKIDRRVYDWQPDPRACGVSGVVASLPPPEEPSARKENLTEASVPGVPRERADDPFAKWDGDWRGQAGSWRLTIKVDRGRISGSARNNSDCRPCAVIGKIDAHGFVNARIPTAGFEDSVLKGEMPTLAIEREWMPTSQQPIRFAQKAD